MLTCFSKTASVHLSIFLLSVGIEIPPKWRVCVSAYIYPLFFKAHAKPQRVGNFT